jgi:hypothetical protein
MTLPRKVASRLLPGYVQSQTVDPQQGLAPAITRYRVMAYTVGVMLLVLVLVGVPLQYGAGLGQVDAVVGPIHGFLYIVYLVTAAGLLPFLAFVIERSVVGRLRREHLYSGHPARD